VLPVSSNSVMPPSPHLSYIDDFVNITEYPSAPNPLPGPDSPDLNEPPDVVQVKFKNSGHDQVKVSWVVGSQMMRIRVNPGTQEYYSFESGKTYNIFFQKEKYHPYAEK
jgi:hypothetical protein